MALCFTEPLFSQDFCAQEALHTPAMRQIQQAFESNYAGDFSARSIGGRGVLQSYTLPVVVHIVHNGGAENITDAMVAQGMQHLNEAFANMGYYDQGTGVNTQIQFCLARRNPQGNATTGINRVVSPLTELNYSTQDIDLKDLIRWDPLRYINIWLVREICNNNGCSVAGYAYLPSAHGSPVDGIVMEAKWFGSSYGHSGVQIHEMGHYLGLYHTFQGGCANDDCLVDGDRVCDTPPDQSTAPVPCNESANSCDTDALSGFSSDQPDMFWNYMDYGDWGCYSAFSLGQADRMAWFIDNVRFSLLDSDGCLDPCLSAISASFNPSTEVVNIGGSVNFINTSANATGFQWSVNGIPFGSGINAAYTFNQLGSFVVTLDATNADPNCYASFSDTIQVVCPVTASFAASNLFPVPGEIVNFANNSAGGLNFAWTVNGAAQAGGMAFSYIFPSEGAYTVCLDVDNGLCAQQYCQLLFAYAQAQECESGFLKTIGGTGVSERAFCFAPEAGGHFLMGGGKEGQSLLLETDPNGTIQWEKAFDVFPGQDEIITSLLVDAEGYILLSGRDDLIVPNVHYLAKYDPVAHTFLWLRTWGSTFYPRIEGLLEKPGNGNYLAYGLVEAGGNDNYIFEINKNTGAVLWQRRFDLGGNSDHFLGHQAAGASLYLAGGQRYSGGLDKIRASIAKMDFSGNMEWSRIYFHTPNQLARTYTVDLHLEGDTLVALGRGSFTGSNLSNSGAHLFKTNLGGELLWGKTYTINGGTEVFARNLLPLPDGYVIQGVFKQNGLDEIFFIRTDKAGNVVWAKSAGTPSSDYSLAAFISGGAIYFAGHTNAYDIAGNSDILFGRLPLNPDNQSEDCALFADISLVVVNIQNTYDALISLNATQTNDVWNVQNIAVQPTASQLNEIAGCECIETSPCVSSFVKSLGDTDVEQGRRLIAEPGGGFLLGGSKADSSLVALLDADGHPVWARAIKGVNVANQQIVDMVLDSDGNLIGVGTGTTPSSTIANFIFKYDYQNDVLLWLQRPNTATFTTGQLLQILEIAPGGNYLVAGQTSPNNPPGSGCDGTLMELDRNSGALVWMKNYQLGSCETFSRIALHANAIYATGRYNFAGGGVDKMRPGVTQLDLDGNQLWSRLYLVDVNAIARLYSADLVIDNGLVIPNHGDMDGTSASEVELQLFKTNYAGAVLWARQYDIPGGHTERFSRLINLPDGYLGLGTYTQVSGGNAIFLLKTDKNGNLEWSRKYAGEAGHDILFQGGHIYLTGTTSGGDALLARLELDGTTPDTCAVVQDLAMVQSPVANPYDGVHPLTVYAPGWPFLAEAGSFSSSYLPENTLCETLCLDSCLIAPDAFFQLLTGACNGDSLSVTVRVCNEGAGILYAGTPVSFYQGEPASLLSIYGLPANLPKDSCLTWTLQLAAMTNADIFAHLNEGGLDGFDELECDFSDNQDSFSVVYAPPLLDLGPDTVMCGFGVVALEAGPGFAGYEWNDGSTESSYTALEPGVHWVVATDSCGGVQRDTMMITSYSDAQTHDTLDICQGDTVLVFGQAVTAAGEYYELLSGFNGCDSVSTVTVAVFDPIVIVVTTVNAGPGEKKGSATAQVSGGLPPYVYNWESGPDDLAPGTYTLTVQDGNGCEAVVSFLIGTAGESRHIYIPNIFSPNGDGANDRFTVFGGSAVALIRKLAVYDRWGELVFDGIDLTPNDLNQGWDGTLRGKAMNPAVFAYIAIVELNDGTVETVNGTVALAR